MEQPPDAGQVAAVASRTLDSAAGLHPAAQVVLAAVLGAALILWIWRKTQPSGPDSKTVMDALTLSVHSHQEAAASMANIMVQTERIASEVREVSASVTTCAEEVRGLTGLLVTHLVPGATPVRPTARPVA